MHFLRGVQGDLGSLLVICRPRKMGQGDVIYGGLRVGEFLNALPLGDGGRMCLSNSEGEVGFV